MFSSEWQLLLLGLDTTHEALYTCTHFGFILNTTSDQALTHCGLLALLIPSVAHLPSRRVSPPPESGLISLLPSTYTPTRAALHTWWWPVTNVSHQCKPSYSLMLPIGPSVKGLVPSSCCYLVVGETLRGRADGSQVNEQLRDPGTMNWTTLFLHSPLCLIHPGVKGNEPTHHQVKLLKLKPK